MSTDGTGSDFDISYIDSDDYAQLAQSIEGYYKKDTTIKSNLAYNWSRNHMFLDGNQWVVYDGNSNVGGVWRNLTVTKANEYIPRPVTNYIFDDYQTLKGYILKSKPRSSVTPNTQTNQDKTAAKIADLCLDCNWERLKEQYNYEYAVSCLLLYGTVFKKSYWDNTATGMVKVPRMKPAPTVDPQTGAISGMQEVQDLDPDGNPLYDELPLGEVNTDVVEPYRIALDPLANDLHKARWIMEYCIVPLEKIREIYGKEGTGYTGLAAEVKEETLLSNSMRRFYNLKSSSGVRGSLLFTEGQTSSEDVLHNSAVLKEYYEKPSFKYPKGRLIAVASNTVLYSGDSPCEGPDLNDWHPYSECRWEIVPGRFWGKSPVDAAVEIQKQINSIDSVIVLNRKTTAVPQKLIPVQSGVSPGSWTGRPGQDIYYRGGLEGKPEVIPGRGVDPQVFEERMSRRKDMQGIMGTVDILQGQAPPSVTAHSALNLLYEVGTGKLFPILDRYKKFVESDQTKQLRIIASKYKENRPDFVKMLHSLNREIDPAAINKFIGQDLNNNCNVRIEAGSNIPKLQAAEESRLMEVAQTGALNLQDPRNRRKFLEDMGINGYDTDVGPDTRRAEWENDVIDDILNNPNQPLMVLEVDDDAIHLQVHQSRMKEPSFLSLPFPVQQKFMMHCQEHQQQQAQKQQEQQIQQMQQMMTNPGNVPPAPKPGATGIAAGGPAPGPKQGPSKPGGGPTKEMKNSLHQDALQPAPLQGSVK